MRSVVVLACPIGEPRGPIAVLYWNTAWVLAQINLCVRQEAPSFTDTATTHPEGATLNRAPPQRRPDRSLSVAWAIICVAAVFVLAASGVVVTAGSTSRTFKQAPEDTLPLSSEQMPNALLSLPSEPTQTLPSSCGTIGSQGYVPPPPPTPNIPLQRGTTVTVATDDDLVNGDTSNVSDLIANPGPDGISLREAIMAINNNDSGQFTIRFAPGLQGSTIRLQNPLPPLQRANVTINGNIDGGTLPGVTLAATGNYSGSPPLEIESSGNVLYALRISNFSTSIGIPSGSDLSLLNNSLANLEIFPGGSRLTGGGWGIDLEFFDNSNSSLEGTYIVNNTVFPVPGALIGNGAIVVGPGTGDMANNNSIADLVIANNTIEGGYDDASIQVRGGYGSSATQIANISVLDNHIVIPTWIGPNRTATGGILVNSGGEGASGDAMRDVWILNNSIAGDGGYGVKVGLGWGASSKMVMTNISLLGNNVSILGTGIDIASEADGQNSSNNSLSGVTIRANTVTENGTLSPQFNPDRFRTAGIYVQGGNGATGDVLQNLSISHNLVKTNLGGSSGGLIGLNIVGGWGYTGILTANDSVSDVLVSCNDITSPPTVSLPTFPWIRGITLVGGYVDTTGSSVVNVSIQDNEVAGVPNNLSAMDNVGSGTSENRVSYTIVGSGLTALPPVANFPAGDIGQPVTFSTLASGGTGVYVLYTWSESATSLGCVMRNAAAITCSPTATGSNYIVAVSVTDSDGVTSSTSTSAHFIVYPNLSAGTLTSHPVSGGIDLGQNVTFSMTPAGGSGGYTYSWIGLCERGDI
jgi:hypothetical protein